MLTLAAYLQRIDPFAIQISGNFGIRWYGLAYVGGFLCAYLFISWLAKRDLTLLPKEKIADFILIVALGTIVGGRLGYCIFYSPHLFIDFSPITLFGKDIPMWGVLKMMDGGMASHGGIIGIILGCLYFARKHKITSLHLFDLTVIGGSIGIFFGRVANFINGELYGRACDPTFTLAVKFPQELTDPISDPRLASVFEQINELKIEGVLTTFGNMHDQLIAAVQQNDQIAAMVEPLLTPRHPSQLYQALLEGVLLFVIFFFIWRQPRKPGLIGAWFLVLYAIVRVIGEQFRLPDAHIANMEFQAIGVTRGQLLSVALFAVGMVLIILWSKRKCERVGGWGKTG